jgi:cytoskeleton protein RodZ
VGSFGDRLKREREKKQITLDEVAVTTKIGTRLLQALEDEKFEQLPGGVFNKGFVRAYAEHLGIDPEQAVADYMEAAGDKPAIEPNNQELRAIAEKREKEKQHPRTTGATRTGGAPWGIVAALLLIGALMLSAWGFYSREQAHDNVQAASETAPPPANSSAPATDGTTPAPNAAAENAPLAAPPPDQVTPIPASQVTSSEPVQEAAPMPEPAPSRRSVRPTTIPALQRDRDRTETDTTPAAAVGDNVNPDAFALQITAREDSWLTLTVDSRIVFQGLLTSAAAKTVLANKQVVLKTGNIGALDISFNGSKIPVQGDENEVKILTFDNNGLEP